MKSEREYARQIASLEGHAAALREQRRLALQGSEERERIVDLLELVASTLTQLRAQQLAAKARPPVRRFVPIAPRVEKPTAPTFAPAPPPVGHLALALPTLHAFLDQDVAAARAERRSRVRDADLEFETVWTPHRDAPSLLGEYPSRGGASECPLRSIQDRG
jgi:hypothetical protein